MSSGADPDIIDRDDEIWGWSPGCSLFRGRAPCGAFGGKAPQKLNMSMYLTVNFAYERLESASLRRRWKLHPLILGCSPVSAPGCC